MRTGKERADLAEQHDLRIERIVDLASAHGSCDFEGSPSSALEDLLDELAEGTDQHTDPSMLPLHTAVADVIDDGNNEELGWRLAQADFFGYVVQFACPAYTSTWDNGMSTYSWGRYRTHWIYAETLDEAWDLAAAWTERKKLQDIERNKKDGTHHQD